MANDQSVPSVSLKELGLQILNLPQELRDNMKWAGSTYKLLDEDTGRRDKAPRNIYTGERISVTSDEGWVTFDEAMNSGYPVLGFKLTEDDPYTVIDLDKTTVPEENANARKIYDAFDSYTELSKSGNGIHIIVRGPSEAGRRKGNIEIYSRERYIICTGNVLKNKPICDGGELLAELKRSLLPYESPEVIPIINSEDETESDDALMRRMFSAANGDQIRGLFQNAPDKGDDWSRLDAQLAQHIAFYTRNHNQALRLFRKSALYRGNGQKRGYERRDKYEQDYLLRMTFARAWHLESERRKAELRMTEEEVRKLEQNYIARRSLQTNNSRAKEGEILPPLTVDTYDQYLKRRVLPPMTHPTGLLGEITDFILQHSKMPVPEISIAGALTMFSGIVGRHYNLNDTGLGLYLVILAGTGRGKESATSGVNLLMSAVEERMPAAAMFRGPSSIASGQGLIKALSDTNEEFGIPSKFCMIAEFGFMLNIICAYDANAADQRTRQVLLDLFSKNRWGNMIRETAYADKSNNTGIIKSPNLSIMGDSTPQSFFKSVTTSIIADGFMPRFMIIEYAGPRLEAVEHTISVPPDDLVTRVITLMTQVFSLRDSNQYINIGYKDEHAKAMIRAFDSFCTRKINENSEAKDTEIWNRAGLKVFRLAGLFAVSENMFEPRVSVANVELAIEYVLRDMLSYGIRFATGAFGGGDEEREAEMMEVIYPYFEGTIDFDAEGVPEEYTKYGVIPQMYLYHKLDKSPVFTSTKKPARVEIDNAILYLIKQGVLRQVEMREIRGNDRKLFTRDENCYCRGAMYDIAMLKRGMQTTVVAPTIAVETKGEGNDNEDESAGTESSG